MRELLERWARAEPRRCLIGPPTTNICASVALGGDGFNFVYDHPTPQRLGLLLAAVLEAIEARGWFWNVGTTLQEPVQAYVQSPERSFRPVRAETPAAALLGAYLAALAAEAGQ